MHDLFLRIKEHDTWRGEECISLIPSENFTSPEVQQILASDMSRRYSLPLNQELHGFLVENAYRGTKYLDEIENLGEKLACKIFNAKYASLKPLSGHVSGLIALLSTCKKGDLILTINSMHGGYDGYMPDYMPSFLGLKVDYLPFVESSWNLDVESCIETIARKKPRAVVVGMSFILFPCDLGRLKAACKDADAHLLYDASHVLGLIPWNFQDPLDEGTDLLFSSTHKSLFGPQGGLMLTNNEELFKSVLESTTWKVLDNAHWNRIAALTQALLEYDKFGRDYGAQVIKNSRALSEELTTVGIPVRFGDVGYTKSHMILLDHEKLQSQYNLSLNELAVRLERSNIIIDAVGRIGLCEVTRLGAKAEHMKRIAGLAKRALKENVRGEVINLRKELSLSFCP